MTSKKYKDDKQAEIAPAAELEAEQTAPAVELEAEQTAPAAELEVEQTAPAAELEAEQTTPAAELEAEQTALAASPVAQLFGIDPAPAAVKRPRGRPRKIDAAAPAAPAATAGAPVPAAPAGKKPGRKPTAKQTEQTAAQQQAATVADAVAAAPGATAQAQLVAQLLRMEGGAVAQLLCSLLGWAPLNQAEQDFITSETSSWSAPEWMGRALMWASIIWPRLAADPRVQRWFATTVAPRLGPIAAMFGPAKPAEPAPVAPPIAQSQPIVKEDREVEQIEQKQARVVITSAPATDRPIADFGGMA